MMNSVRYMLSDIDEESNEDGPRKERLILENDVHIGRGGEINKKRQDRCRLISNNCRC